MTKDKPAPEEPATPDQLAAPDERTAPAASAAGTSVELVDVTVRVGDRPLLENVNAHFAPGRVTLVIGCSGVGKSVLLRILANLVGPADSAISVEGLVSYMDEAGEGPRQPPVGIVFQNFALFDEFTPAENVAFAEAHRTGGRGEVSPQELLQALEVPRGTPTSSLSGGQKQRLAIARTLAYGADVVLYDEPTSGLDTITAERVAKLISETHDRFPRTSIIVTHDYETLPSIADDIFLLDPQRRTLSQVPREYWGRLHDLLNAPAAASPPKDAGPRGLIRRFASRCTTAVADFFDMSTRAVMAFAAAPVRLVPLCRSPLWGARYLLHYLRLTAGPSAWVYVAVAGMIIGFVTTYFTFKFLPYANYTEPLLIEDLLRSVGFSLYRILVPVLTTILVAARSGAAVASDVGGKTYGHQIDAMRTLGAPPERYLLTTILWAFLLGTPVLVAIAYLVATFTSLLVFLVTHPAYGAVFWDMHYHRELRVGPGLIYAGTGWLLGKTLLCALGTALVCYHRGAVRKRSTREVSDGITTSILWSTLWVLVVQFAFSFFEFE